MPLHWIFADTVAPEALADPDSKFVDVGKVRVHYKEYTKQGLSPTEAQRLPTILLLHGFAGRCDFQTALSSLRIHVFFLLRVGCDPRGTLVILRVQDGSLQFANYVCPSCRGTDNSCRTPLSIWKIVPLVGFSMVIFRFSFETKISCCMRCCDFAFFLRSSHFCGCLSTCCTLA